MDVLYVELSTLSNVF